MLHRNKIMKYKFKKQMNFKSLKMRKRILVKTILHVFTKPICGDRSRKWLNSGMGRRELTKSHEETFRMMKMLIVCGSNYYRIGKNCQNSSNE